MSNTKKAILALMLANIIWGAGAPIFKWSFTSLHPFTLAFLRFLIPALFIGIVLGKKVKIKTKDFPTVFLAGLFIIAINIIFFFLGIQLSLSIDALIIASSGPVFILLGSMMFLKERVNRKMMLGNLLGLSGIIVIVLQPLLQKSSAGSVLGNFFLIIAMFSSVIGVIFSKKAIKKYSPMVVS
ncbi:MAG: DMT family transporter, partial [Candidatus Levyibacteriota bacterium]